MVGSLFAQDDTISLAFNELSAFLEKSSPQVTIINAESEHIQTERDLAMQWSNPELIYDHEIVKNNNIEVSEYAISLGKTFSFPWNYWNEGNIWDKELAAADLRKSQKKVQLLTRARSHYAQIQLLHGLVERQKYIKKNLDNLGLIIKARQEEGAISQIDKTLFEMSIFNVQADLIQSKQELRQEINHFKQVLGIPSETELCLTTTIDFKPVQVQQINRNNFLQKHPGLQSHQLQLTALNRRISLEKGLIMPSFTIEGGYKKVKPDFEGYVVGLSLPLPLLNWNQPQVEETIIRHRIQLAKTGIYQQNLESASVELIQTIMERQEILEDLSNQEKEVDLVENLSNAYQEGSLSYTEFLNAIQLYVEGSRQYAGLLTVYYQAVFQLESISTQQLVTF